MTTAFPEKLDRLPYLYRFLALSLVAAVLFYAVFLLTLHTKFEALVLIPSAGWLVAKMVILDTARLRSIGWSPNLSFLNLLLPITVFFQLLLFFLSPKRV